ncbi:glycosyltransferase, partial [candidate division CSSED10-310 bacterium]
LFLWQTMLDSFPDSRSAYENMGKVLLNKGEYERAETIYKELRTKYHDHPAGVRGLIQVAISRRQWDDAIQLYDQAYRHFSEKTTFLQKKAMLLRKLFRYDEALPLFQRFRKKEPWIFQNWFHEMSIYLMQNLQQESKAVLAEAQNFFIEKGRIDQYILLLEAIGSHDEARIMRQKSMRLLDFNTKPMLWRIYLDWGRLDVCYELLNTIQSGYNETSRFLAFKRKFNSILKATGTHYSTLQEYCNSSQSLTVEHCVVNRVCDSAISGSNKTLDRPNLVFCNHFCGIGGSQKSLVHVLKMIDDDFCGFKGVHLVVEEARQFETGRKSFIEVVQNLTIELHYIDKSTDNIHSLRQDINTREWIDAILLLPTPIKRTLLGYYQIFNKLKPACIILWGTWYDSILSGGLAALLAGCEHLVLACRGVGNIEFDQHNSVTSSQKSIQIRYALLKMLSLPHVSLLSNSHSNIQKLQQLLDLDLQHSPVINNALDPALIESDVDFKEGENQFRIPDIRQDAFIIGSVFRLSQLKRPFLWLQIAERVTRKMKNSNLQFILVGDGPMMCGVRAMVDTLNLSEDIIMVGETPCIKPLLHKMDLFLFTSLTEGLANVIIEAQYLGIPVVTTDAGSMEEILVDGETGWIVDSDDPDVIADRVCWCINNKHWLKNTAEKAKEHVSKTFDMNKISRQTRDYLSGLARQHRNSSETEVTYEAG